MTPEQFNNLREGDIIRNKNGNGFSVLENKGNAVLAQCTLSVHAALGGYWTLVSQLCPVPQPLPRPPVYRMHEDLLANHGLIIESKEGKKYRLFGRVYPTLEAAWDAIPTPTL